MKDEVLSRVHFMPMKRVIAVDDVESMVAQLDADPRILHLETALGGWLHLAAKSNAVKCARALLERGVAIDAYYNSQMGSALNVACSKGHLEMVVMLLDHGASTDAPRPELHPLFSAVYANRPDIAQRLVESGASASIEFQGGWTPLRYAEEMGKGEVADWLRQAKTSAGR